MELLAFFIMLIVPYNGDCCFVWVKAIETQMPSDIVFLDSLLPPSRCENIGIYRTDKCIGTFALKCHTPLPDIKGIFMQIPTSKKHSVMEHIIPSRYIANAWLLC